MPSNGSPPRRLFKGATLLHLDTGAVEKTRVEKADVLAQGGRIVDVAPGLSVADAEVVDVSGKWLMPGLVCGHHHLYSALACGMPFVDAAPVSFADMLSKVWWRLDRALDEDSVRQSGYTGGLGALSAGVTTIVDHHASPSFIEGSLEVLDEALADIGQRRILCYEVTDRGGLLERDAGLNAHIPLLKKGRSDERAVLIGGHASFTLSEASLSKMGALAREYDVGTHIHVAEARDDVITVGEPLIARLERTGCLRKDSLFAHGVFLSTDEFKRIEDAGAYCTHQSRSNQNNAVGHAPVSSYPKGSMLGTDGIGGDMFAELQAAYFRCQEAGDGLFPPDALTLLTDAARYASSQLDVTVGKIEKGAAADLVVLDVPPGPPLHTDNLAAAMVFRLSAGLVRDVYISGAPALKDRVPTRVDAALINNNAERAALGLWKRMRDADAASSSS